MVRRKPKIAVFHLGFFYSGGGERLVLEEIKGLRNRGYEVTCFAPVVDEKLSYPEILANFKIQSLLPQLPAWFPSREGILIIASCFLIPFLIPRFRKFDVVYGANQPGPWYGWVIEKLLGKPYLIYLAQPTRMLYPREVDLEAGFKLRRNLRALTYLVELGKPFIFWADKKSIKGAKVMLTGGEYTGKLIEKTYGKKRTVCYAACYPLSKKKLVYKKRWQGKLKVNGQGIKKPFVLLTNRHAPQKKFEYAISAMAAVLKEAPETSLVITGEENEYTEFLKFLVKQLGLKEKIIFLGLVKEKDLQQLYQQAAVYVYPAPQEDFGMGVVEAMAAGTPVVAWNFAGPTDTVANGKTGFLAKPYDILDYAEKIVKLLKNPSLAEKMGRAGWQRAKENFSYEKRLDILEREIERALEI